MNKKTLINEKIKKKQRFTIRCHDTYHFSSSISVFPLSQIKKLKKKKILETFLLKKGEIYP